MRADLLALSDDDLAALSNRGTARRARSEITAGEPRVVALDEQTDGTLVATWSDGVTCTLPRGVSPARCRCTCPAQPPCRHLVRTVMAYQREVGTAPAAARPESTAVQN